MIPVAPCTYSHLTLLSAPHHHQILQMAAALEDPDEFIMTLMLRYGIHHWLAPNFESVMRRVRFRNSCYGRDYRRSQDICEINGLSLNRCRK